MRSSPRHALPPPLPRRERVGVRGTHSDRLWDERRAFRQISRR
ncbi:hypothetical protein [Azospirillum doebereinerae]